MNSTHKYITDPNGQKLAIILPMGEYNQWQAERAEYQRLRVLNDLIEGLRYVDEARAGRKPKRPASELLAEL
jgi:hypothetical protein